MENIWLKYTEPGAYKEMRGLNNSNLNGFGKQIDDFIKPIDSALRKAGFNFEIRKRVKTPY